MASVAAMVTAIPGPVALLGYSLGAMVVSGFLAEMEAGGHQRCEVEWAGMVANPLRIEGDSVDPAPTGWGIAGERDPSPEALPVWEVANPDDVITSCPGDSPLRTLADGVTAFSLADLDDWGQDLVNRLLSSRWQLTSADWWRDPFTSWRRYDLAARHVIGYLNGQHTTAYVEDGHCARLATLITAHTLTVS